MNKQLPILAGSVALTACNSSKINIDQITRPVAFCQEQVKCTDNVYRDLFFSCDGIAPTHLLYLSVVIQNLLIYLPVQSKRLGAPCRSDFEEAKDYEDYLEDLYEDYYMILTLVKKNMKIILNALTNF